MKLIKKKFEYLNKWYNNQNNLNTNIFSILKLTLLNVKIINKVTAYNILECYYNIYKMIVKFVIL